MVWLFTDDRFLGGGTPLGWGVSTFEFQNIGILYQLTFSKLLFKRRHVQIPCVLILLVNKEKHNDRRQLLHYIIITKNVLVRTSFVLVS